MPQSLRDSLAEYPRIMLEAIAEGWGIVLTDEQTPEIVERLAAEMVHPESVQFVLRRLEQVELEALAYVAAVGQVKAHVMARKYGAIRRLGPGRLEWEAAWRQPISPAERLWFLGLICREYAKEERYHGEVFYVPAELRASLPPLSIQLPSFRIRPAASPPVVHDDGDDLAHDVFVVLSYVRSHEVRARTPRSRRRRENVGYAANGILTVRELAALCPRLAGSPDPQEPSPLARDAERGVRTRGAYPQEGVRRSSTYTQRLHFLLHLCQSARLIAVKEEQWAPTAEAAAWLKSGDIARRRVLYQAWLEDAGWNELWRMPGIHCEDTGWRNDPLLPRQVVTDYLRQCAVGAWLTMQSFVDSLHEVAPDLMRPDGDYDSWYIRDTRTGQYLMGWGSWDKVEGALIHYLLRYPLRWLGVVAIGQAGGEVDASSFQLTQRGAAVLGSGGLVESQPQHMRVQADLQVVVPPGVSWYDRFLLERFARWVGEKDGLARYHLDGELVRAYLAGGVTIERIRAFLRRVTGNRLPPEVTHALQSWARTM